MKRTLVLVASIMSADLGRLRRMKVNELQAKYKQLFGDGVPSGNSELLRRKIAWQLQAKVEGGLPESARQHALGIARAAKRPKPTNSHERLLTHSSVARLVLRHDSRIPPPGSMLVKDFRGKQLTVRVLNSGFEYDKREFASLSAVAKEITGTKWNGFLFFGLIREHGNGG